MIGNYVKVYLKDGSNFCGILQKIDSTCIIVHRREGLDDTKKLIPMQNIIEVLDQGHRRF